MTPVRRSSMCISAGFGSGRVTPLGTGGAMRNARAIRDIAPRESVEAEHPPSPPSPELLSPPGLPASLHRRELVLKRVVKQLSAMNSQEPEQLSHAIESLHQRLLLSTQLFTRPPVVEAHGSTRSRRRIEVDPPPQPRGTTPEGNRSAISGRRAQHPRHAKRNTRVPLHQLVAEACELHAGGKHPPPPMLPACG